jgi:uncharacterized membrane protein YqhA
MTFISCLVHVDNGPENSDILKILQIVLIMLIACALLVACYGIYQEYMALYLEKSV